jgi:hypothetical protein
MAILVVMSLQGESASSTAEIREDITTAAEYFTMVDQHFKTEKQLAALSNLPMATEEEVSPSPVKAVDAPNAAKAMEAKAKAKAKAKAPLLSRKRVAAKAASPTAAYEDLMDGQELALEMDPQKDDEDTTASDKAIAAGAVEDAFLEVKLKTKLAKQSGDTDKVITAGTREDEAIGVKDMDVDDFVDDSDTDTDARRMVMIPQTEAERMLEAASYAASSDASEDLEDASDDIDVPEDDLLEEESTSSAADGRIFATVATETQKKKKIVATEAPEQHPSSIHHPRQTPKQHLSPTMIAAVVTPVASRLQNAKAAVPGSTTVTKATAPHRKELSGPEKMLAGAMAAASKEVKVGGQSNGKHAATERNHMPAPERAQTTKHRHRPKSEPVHHMHHVHQPKSKPMDKPPNSMATPHSSSIHHPSPTTSSMDQSKPMEKSPNKSEDVRVIKVSKSAKQLAQAELEDLAHANDEFHQAQNMKKAQKVAAQARLEQIWAHAKVEAQLKANTPAVNEVAAAAAAGAVAGNLFVEPTEARMVLTKKKKAKKAKKVSPKKKAIVKPKKKVVVKPKSLSQMTGELLKTVDSDMNEEEGAGPVAVVPVPFHDDLLDKVQALHKAVADKASVLEAKDRRIAKKRQFQHDLMNGSDLHGNSKLERTIAFGKKVDQEHREKRLAKAKAKAAKAKALSKVHKKVKLLNVPRATHQTTDKGVELLRSHLKGFWEKVHAVTAPKATKVVKKKVVSVKKKKAPISPMMKNLMLNARAQHKRDMHHKPTKSAGQHKVRKKLGGLEHHDDLEDIVANAVNEHQQEVDRRAHELLKAPTHKVHLFDQLVSAYGEDNENSLEENAPFVSSSDEDNFVSSLHDNESSASSKESAIRVQNPDAIHDTVGADAVEAVTAKLQMKRLLGLDNDGDQDSQTVTPLQKVFSSLNKSGRDQGQSMGGRREDYFSAHLQEIMSGKKSNQKGHIKRLNAKSNEEETPIWEKDKFAQLMRVKLARERAQDMMHAALAESSAVSNDDKTESRKTVSATKHLTRQERIAEKMKLMHQGLQVRL